MTSDLREELAALADTQTFSPDPSAWDRGRRVRRRDGIVRGAAVLAVVAVVAGAGALAIRPDAVDTAGGVDREGAIPSVIPEPVGPVVSYREITRASVAYVDDATRMPVLVDAATGAASLIELPGFPEPEIVDLTEGLSTGPLLAVSPDGRRVAYAATVLAEGPAGQPSFITTFYRVVDLKTGDASALLDVPLRTGTPRAISWTTDGKLSVDVYGLATESNVEPPVESWTIDPETGDNRRSELTGIPAPGGGISATYPLDDDPVSAVPFESSTGTDPSRELPTDLYPDGATVTPVGWADDFLVVAQVGEDLALLTSPDRPESEWVFRILVSDLPETSSLSLAVDLVPDLDGTPSQELTHDFGDNPLAWTGIELSLLIGLGVATAIAVLMALRWLWRRLVGRRA